MYDLIQLLSSAARVNGKDAASNSRVVIHEKHGSIRILHYVLCLLQGDSTKVQIRNAMPRAIAMFTHSHPFGIPLNSPKLSSS